jgi:hypothetical protein
MNPQSNPPASSNRMMADGDRTSSRYYERFHLNQFYNAVEDEQLYTDEYTNMLQSYNQFILTGNAMFSRMEQGLRANLDRSITRQSFYYHRYSDIRRIRSPDEAIYHFTHAPAAAPAPAPAAAPAPAPAAAPPAAAPPAPAAAPPAPADASRRSRLGDAFGRMLSNYLTAENNRNARENMYRVRNDDETGTGAANTNLFSMLYTYAQPIVSGAAAAVTGAANAERGPPSAATINRATLNTRYASIVSPVNSTCPISRDEFEDNSEITMIRGCNHIFNRASLREWFVNHSTCPMCRNDIHNYRDDVSNIYSRIMDNSRNFTNMEINNVTNDSVTFSYDLPPMYDRYNDEEIYRDILTAVAGTAATTTTTTTTTTQAPPAVTRDYRYDDPDPDNDHDSHDYMEVD